MKENSNIVTNQPADFNTGLPDYNPFSLNDAIEYFFRLQDIINLAIIVVFTLALFFFIWGVALFILNAGNEEKRESGKKKMFWGVITLLVVASIWGIVLLFQVVFDVDSSISPELPPIPGQNF